MLGWIQRQLNRFLEMRQQRAQEYLDLLKWRYQVFRSILFDNTRAVDLITELDLQLREASTIWPSIKSEVRELSDITGEMVTKLNDIDYDRHKALVGIHAGIVQKIDALLKEAEDGRESRIPFYISLDDVYPEYEKVAGGKATSLSRLKAHKGFSVPDGFAIPVTACQYFLDQTGLSMKILSLLQAHLLRGHGISDELEAQVKEEILDAELPKPLEVALLEAAGPFFKGRGPGLAVRSSALSEDSRRHSFAGQFTTVLNVVDGQGFIRAFKEVVASNFNSRSIAYRSAVGMRPLDFNMAVLSLKMIDAQKAGILFSVDPNSDRAESMLISAVYGMGELAVSGASMSDVYKPLRDLGGREGEKILAAPPVIAKKTRQLVCRPEGGLMEADVPEELQDEPVLSMEQIRELVRLGLEIEEIFGTPQDMEWAVDKEGRIWILQTRPLILHQEQQGGETLEQGPSNILLKGGLITSRGKATGRVVIIRSRKDLEQLPDGPVIMVMHQSLVDAAKLLEKASGVLVDLGNPADHLSCVAREYGRPMITGLVRATELLEPGQWITVDANRALVYEATEEEIEQQGRQEGPSGAKAGPKGSEQEGAGQEQEGTQDPRIKRLRELTVKLNLTDAYGPTFSILECRSLHDIVRYVHEKAVLAIFEAGDELLEGTSGVVLKLKSDIPFFLNIIDIGGGLPKELKGRRWVRPEEIVCRPFRALWKGIATPGLRWSTPPPVVADMGSVMGRWLSDQRSRRPIGMPNYVIISKDYMNLNARMDFHFTMVDSVCGLDLKSNYVKFRFKGGGTSMVRRHRRALALAEILEDADFFIDIKGDLVNAYFGNAPAELIEEKLVVLGRLLGFTRLLDAAMKDDETPHLIAQAFKKGDYQLEELLELWKREEAEASR